MDGAAQSGLGFPTSIINQKNDPTDTDTNQYNSGNSSVHISSFQKTLGSVSLTIKTK